MGWPKAIVPGHLNEMAICKGCGRDATQTCITYYCVDALNGGPYLCDECRTKQAEEE